MGKFLDLDDPKLKVKSVGNMKSSYEGLIVKFKRIYLGNDAEKMTANLREHFKRIVTRGPCEACGGTRLSEAARVQNSRAQHGGSICAACERVARVGAKTRCARGRATCGAYHRALEASTTGLHMADVAGLISLLDRMVDNGSRVIVIEHNLHVIARADWIVDMGPGARNEGGRVVFEGVPDALVREAASLTGQHLALRTA